MKYITLIAALAFTSATHAQSMERMAQATINVRGHACASVTSVRPLGMAGSIPLVAAYCSDGTGHVLKILPNDTFEYLTTCAAYNAVATRKC